MKSLQPSKEPDMRELLAFLRTENEAARAAVREDSDANRKILTDSLKIIAYPVTAALAILSFLGFRSVTEMKKTIQSEAISQTSAEVRRMQEEIRGRLSEQFQTPNLKAIVGEAARSATATSAQPLIKAEVSTQVGRSIATQKGEIRKSVTDQTQQAVKQMGGTIDAYVKEAVDSKVASSVTPVVSQVRDLSNEANLEMLILRMNADDATAFDMLLNMPLGTLPTEHQKTIVGALQREVDQYNGAGIIPFQKFNDPHDPGQLQSALSSNISNERDAALTGLETPVDPMLISNIIQMATSDNSIAVRAHAQRIFNTWTGAKTRILIGGQVTDWWKLNSVEFLKSHPTQN